MKLFCRILIFILILALPVYSYPQEKVHNEYSGQNKMPHLNKQGKTTRFIIDDKFFLIPRGEPANSSFANLECLEPVWPGLKTMNLNIVPATVL